MGHASLDFATQGRFNKVKVKNNKEVTPTPLRNFQIFVEIVFLLYKAFYKMTSYVMSF